MKVVKIGCKYKFQGERMCPNDNCKEHYPVIPRTSILNEIKANVEDNFCKCIRECEDCGKLIK